MPNIFVLPQVKESTQVVVALTEKTLEPTMEINFSWPSNNSDKNDFAGNSFLRFEEELGFSIAICVFHVIICFAALFGNAAIILTILKTSSLHSAANILLGSLAVSDLAVGLISQPLYIGGLVCGIDTVFSLFNIVGTFLSIASFFNVTAIGIDRLLVLQLVTPFRVTVVVSFIWIISGIFASTRSWNSAVSYSAPTTTFICFLVGNFVVYLKIYLIVLRHQRQIQHQQQQVQQQQHNDIFRLARLKKTALNTFLVYIVLLCCYIPYSITISIMAIAGVSLSPSVYVTTSTLVFLNSSLNPLLYCWRDREIRAAMKQLLRCC